jgi:hypothetical protein
LEEPSIGSVSFGGTSFDTGSNPDGYILNSIQLEMADASGNPSDFALTLYVISNPFSGFETSLGALNGSTDPSAAGIYTYTAPSNLMLSPNTQYVFKGTAMGSGAFQWSMTDTASSNAGGGWSGSGFGNFSIATEFPQYAITATAVPEPSSSWLLLLGSGVLIYARRKYIIR